MFSTGADIERRRAVLFKVNPPLGDNLLFVPVVQQLRRSLPEVELILYASPASAPLYRGALSPHSVHWVDKPVLDGAWKSPTQFLKLWRQYRSDYADAVLLSFDQGTLPHALTRFAQTPIRVGASNSARWASKQLTHPIPYAKGMSIAAWNWTMGRTLAETLGAQDWPVQPAPPDLSHLIAPATPKARRRVVIHPGASRLYRTWPADSFTTVARKLSRDFDVVWIHDAAQADPSPDDLGSGISVANCGDIGSLVSVIAHADLFLGNHSGPLQVAAAVGTPGVVVSGPTNSEWDPAWHSERFLILRAPGVSCIPCEQHLSWPFVCRNTSEPLACLRRWDPASVEQQCRAWLNKHS
jgi:heptosyltransferase II